MGEFPGVLRPLPLLPHVPTVGATLVVALRSPHAYAVIPAAAGVRSRRRRPYSRSSLYMTSCGNISSHGCFRSVSPCASEKDCAMSNALALAPMP